MTDNFRLTYGVRFDVPFFEDGTVNDDFNTRTVGLLEAVGKDLQGRELVSPSIAKYMLPKTRIQLGCQWR
jgi:hypothetical protein